MIMMAMLSLVMMSASDYVPQRGDYTFRTRLCVSLSDYDDEATVDSIVVYLTDATGRIDSLVADALPLNPEQWNGIGDIRQDDINFDGFDDLLVCEGPMNSYGNFVYDAFVWVEARHRFEPVENFYEIFNPEPVSSEKAITGWFRMGNDIEYTRHEWRNGKLVEVERTSEQLDEP